MRDNARLVRPGIATIKGGQEVPLVLSLQTGAYFFTIRRPYLDIAALRRVAPAGLPGC